MTLAVSADGSRLERPVWVIGQAGPLIKACRSISRSLPALDPEKPLGGGVTGAASGKLPVPSASLYRHAALFSRAPNGPVPSDLGGFVVFSAPSTATDGPWCDRTRRTRTSTEQEKGGRGLCQCRHRSPAKPMGSGRVGGARLDGCTASRTRYECSVHGPAATAGGFLGHAPGRASRELRPYLHMHMGKLWNVALLRRNKLPRRHAYLFDPGPIGGSKPLSLTCYRTSASGPPHPPPSLRYRPAGWSLPAVSITMQLLS